MIPESIKIVCGDLRNNSTKAEVILWNYLKSKQLGCRFLRQHPLYLYTENSGFERYIIPDFYCKERKIIIEVDGSIHKIEDVYLLDLEKEKLIIQKGFKIIRFTNEEILYNLDDVLYKIKLLLL